MRPVVAAAALVASALPALAFAQAASPALRAPSASRALPGVFFVAAVGASATDPAFDQDVTFTLFAEDATIRGPVAVARAPRYEAQLGFRVWRRIGVGVTAAYFQQSGDLRADFRLPSPFVVGAPIEVSGTASASRRVVDLHVQALIGLVGSEHWNVTAFVGPSMTYLEQQFGHDVFGFDFEFPFTEATLVPRDRTTSGTGVGGHGGVSLTRRFGGLGLVGTVRFSSVKADLDAFDTPFQLETGGVQVSAGLRFTF